MWVCVASWDIEVKLDEKASTANMNKLKQMLLQPIMPGVSTFQVLSLPGEIAKLTELCFSITSIYDERVWDISKNSGAGCSSHMYNGHTDTLNIFWGNRGLKLEHIYEKHRREEMHVSVYFIYSSIDFIRN